MKKLALIILAVIVSMTATSYAEDTGTRVVGTDADMAINFANAQRLKKKELEQEILLNQGVLGDMSLGELKLREIRLQTELKRIMGEIEQLLSIYRMQYEWHARIKEKKEIMKKTSPQHEVQELEPRVNFLARQAEALTKQRRLLEEQMRIREKQKMERRRIVELQTGHKFRIFCLSVGRITNTKSEIGESEAEYFGEIGGRFPLPSHKWTSIGLFVGAYHDKRYAGITVFVPIVSPSKGKHYGSWTELGLIYDDKLSGVFGLSIEAQRLRVFARYITGAEMPLQIGIGYLF